MLLQIRFLFIILLSFQMVFSEDDVVQETKSQVLILDKLNFDEAIKEGVVLVHFYSPTNQACTDVAPILEKLTQKVASDGIKIGKVDCRAADNFNRQLCVDNRVASFPTLNLYKDGVKIVKFPQDGRRTLEEFEYFVKNLEVRTDKDEL